MIRKKSQSQLLSALILVLAFADFPSAVWAEKPVNHDSACDKKEAELQKEGCSSHLKRIQLQTKKLTPQIRAEEIKRDSEFDLKKLYPFIVGSGLVN